MQGLKRPYWIVALACLTVILAAGFVLLNQRNPVPQKTLTPQPTRVSPEVLLAELGLRADPTCYPPQELEQLLSRLLDLLRSGEPERMQAALEGFSRLGSRAKSAVPGLLGLLTSGSGTQQTCAGEALVKIGAPTYLRLERQRLQAAPEMLPLIEKLLSRLPQPVFPPEPSSGPVEAEPVPTEAVPPPPLKVNLTFAGRPFAESAPKEGVLQFRDDSAGQTLVARATEDPSAYLLLEVAHGARWITVLLDARTGQPHGAPGPGDFHALFQYERAARVSPAIPVALRKVLHLTAPENNAGLLARPKTITSPVRFAWELLGDGMEYEYKVWGRSLSSEIIGRTRETSCTLDLPPGVHYHLELQAFRDAQPIGMLSCSEKWVRSTDPLEEKVYTESRYSFTVRPENDRPVTVRGSLSYDGKPLQGFSSRPVEVEFWELIENKTLTAFASLEGHRFRMDRVKPGGYVAKVILDARADNRPGYPGDFIGKLNFGLRGKGDEEFEFPMLRILRLLEPEDSLHGVLAYRSSERPALLTSPVTLAWEPLGEGITYHYAVRGTDSEPLKGSTTDSHLRLELKPSRSTYHFSLWAYRGRQALGALYLNGTYHDLYPFRVLDESDQDPAPKIEK